MSLDHKRSWTPRERTIYAMGLVNSRSRAQYELDKLRQQKPALAMYRYEGVDIITLNSKRIISNTAMPDGSINPRLDVVYYALCQALGIEYNRDKTLFIGMLGHGTIVEEDPATYE